MERTRRLRTSNYMRDMVRENHVRIDELIYPIFVTEGENIKHPVESMPGIYQYSLDRLSEEINRIKEAGIKAILIFGIPDHKDEVGSGAYAEDGIVPKAIRQIKKEYEELLIIADVCLCEYTSHGHCGLVKDGVIDFTDIDITEEEIKKYSQIYIVACGSAWHVGVEAQYVIEELAQIPVRVELASEFRYREMPLVKDGLVIVISQSGETADTLAAMRMAKDKGLATLAVVNVIGSSIAREADKVFYTLAGPEISVATTKGYSAQLVALDCIAVQFAKVKGLITDEQYSYYISELQTIPEKIEKILQDKERIQWFAAKYANAHDVFFVGRGVDYAVCLEGSLKLKEISYIHSEAYAAGELKHGTISLIEDNILVIGVLTQSKLYEKTVSNMMECKSRGAYLMGVTNYGNYEMEDKVDFTVYVPKVDEHFMGSLAVIPLQLLGYYVSVAKGLDVDKPRNLAKSVTVE